MKLRPRDISGVCGQLLVAALYLAHAELARWRGSGLPAYSLLFLVLPGMLAGHLAWREGTPSTASREGLLSGVIMAHFGSALLVSVLAIGVLTTDWTRYAARVGQEVAEGVHDAAILATVSGAALTVALVYAGCALLGWLGSLLYCGVRQAAS